MIEETNRQEESIGQVLRRLRGDTSLKGVKRLTGILNAYLSQVEKGIRHLGRKLLRRLAALYGVRGAGASQEGRVSGQGGRGPVVDETAEVERTYQYVIADPVFRVGTRPRGHLSIESKRFIVEQYERYSGKRLMS